MAAINTSSFSASSGKFTSSDTVTFRFNLQTSGFRAGSYITRVGIKLTTSNSVGSFSYVSTNIPSGDTGFISIPKRVDITGGSIRATTVNVTIRAVSSMGESAETTISNTYTLLNKRYKPTITTFALFRALSTGVENDEGENLLSTIRLYANGNSATTLDTYGFTVKLYYLRGGKHGFSLSGTPIDLTDNLSDLMNGVTKRSLFSNTFSKSSDWCFALRFGDSYEATTIYYSVGKPVANVHLAGGDGLGVCFGGFCKRSDEVLGTDESYPLFENYYRSVFYEDVVADKGLTVKGAINAQGGIINSSDYYGTRSYVGSFGKYPTDGCDPTLKTSGSVAFLSGIITPTTTITGNATQHIICTIPTEYAPKNIVSVLQQGARTATWLLRIYPSGHSEYPAQVTFARHRSGASYTDTSAGDWLPFSATWIF